MLDTQVSPIDSLAKAARLIVREGYVALDHDNRPFQWSPSSPQAMRVLPDAVDVMNVQNGSTYGGQRLNSAEITHQIITSGFVALRSDRSIIGWASTQEIAATFRGTYEIADLRALGL